MNDNPKPQEQTGDAQPGSARKERLRQGLLTLASWAQSRANGEHDDETTLTMLERKAAELRSAVNKAGWAAIADRHSPNNHELEP